MEQISKPLRHYNYLASEIDAAYHRLNVRLGMSDTVSYILYALNEAPTCSQSDVVKKTGLSKQTVSSAVKKMIGDGILMPLKGKRNERLVLTAKGKRLIDEKISVIVHIENQIFDHWDDARQRLFNEMNEEYLAILKEEIQKL